MSIASPDACDVGFDFFFECLVSFSGVVSLVGLLDLGPCDFHIDMGDGEIGMTEHLLHGPDVGSVFNELGGEGMAEGVGGDVFLDLCGSGIASDLNPDDLLAEGPSALVDEEGADAPVFLGVVRPDLGDVFF